MRHHVCQSIEGGLRQNRRTLGVMFRNRETGRSLTADEAKSVLLDYKARGFEVVPSCDNHDERGYCKGCPAEGGLPAEIAGC